VSDSLGGLDLFLVEDYSYSPPHLEHETWQGRTHPIIQDLIRKQASSLYDPHTLPTTAIRDAISEQKEINATKKSYLLQH
jgi:hypothetical protein